MPDFAFRARDRAGRSTEGTLTAADSSSVASRLRSQGLLVVEVRESPGGASTARNGARSTREDPVAPELQLSLPPSRMDVETSLRQLALMLDSGMTLLEGLRSVAGNARRRSMGRVLSGVASQVERGSTFHAALGAWPRAFPTLVRELVRAGEQSGTLETSLVRGADHLEQRREIRAQVAQAMLYPSIVVALAVVVTGLMMTTVIPELEAFFAGSRATLPAVTRALLDISAFVRENGPYISIGLVAATATLFALDRFPPGQRVIDRITYSIPLLGTIRMLGSTALFSRSLSVLVGSGLSLVTSLEALERLLHRPTARDAIARARRGVVAGEPLADGLEGSKAFAVILPRMIRIGERSGNLERVLSDAAKFHELELKAWIRRASYVVEPTLTIVVGGIVGFVYVAFFIAMFAAAGGIK